MSCEVDRTNYLYSSRNKDDLEAYLDDLETYLDDMDALLPAEEEGIPIVPFRYNYIHDMESVFWVALWMLICIRFVRNDDNLSEAQWDEYMNRHRAIANKIYDDPRSREDVFNLENALRTEINGALPQVEDLVLILSIYRGLIVAAFQTAEKEPGNVCVDFNEQLYTTAIKIFDKLLTGLKEKDLVICQKSADARKKVTRAVKTYPEQADVTRDAPLARERDDSEQPDGSGRPPKSRKTSGGSSATDKKPGGSGPAHSLRRRTGEKGSGRTA